MISYKVLVQSSYKLNANLRMNSLNIKFAEFSNFINSISNKVHILFKRIKNMHSRNNEVFLRIIKRWSSKKLVFYFFLFYKNTDFSHIYYAMIAVKWHYKSTIYLSIFNNLSISNNILKLKKIPQFKLGEKLKILHEESIIFIKKHN